MKKIQLQESGCGDCTNTSGLATAFENTFKNTVAKFSLSILIIYTYITSTDDKYNYKSAL